MDRLLQLGGDKKFLSYDDLNRELPENVRKEMTFIFAERVEQVLEAAIPQLSMTLLTV